MQSGFFPNQTDIGVGSDYNISNIFKFMDDNISVYHNFPGEIFSADNTSYTELIKSRSHAKTFEPLLNNWDKRSMLSESDFNEFRNEYIKLAKTYGPEKLGEVLHKWLKLGSSLNESFSTVIGKDINAEQKKELTNLYKVATNFNREYF